jgi:NADH dehydrogenase
MKVIIAGGTGFLGRHVTAALGGAGHELVLLARGHHQVNPRSGMAVFPWDAAAEGLSLEPPPESLKESDAIVNLIGIKRELGTQTFERVHVLATANLIRLAKALGIKRFLHISVVSSRPDKKSAYHDTKWRAEELVKESGLEVTILKPGVIFGPGDDMVTHLVKMLRFFPLFPIVGKGRSLLQPIHANDVAKAVLLALERPLAIGKSYDIVGPRRMTLRQVVQAVAEGMAMKPWIVSTPIWLHRLAVHGMNALLSNPLATPAQLQMLIDGLYGDLEPARRELGLEPGPFTADAVRALETDISSPRPPLCWPPLRRPPRFGLTSCPWRNALGGMPLEKGARDYLCSDSLPQRWNRSA